MQVKSSEGNWFLIICSWEKGADDAAVQRFHKVYKYLAPLAPEFREKGLVEIAKKDSNDPRLSLVPDSLKSLNLIGRRKFVIICQTTSINSNRVLQALSLEIGLGAPVSVEIIPATYVHDLMNILPKKQTDRRSKKKTP